MEAARELDRVPKASNSNMVVALQQAVGLRISGGAESIDFDVKMFEFIVQIHN